MFLVDLEDIPIGEDVPEGNLIEVYKTCLLMEKICIESNGQALAAVQIGIPWNLFVVPNHCYNKYQTKYFLNCKYEGIGEKQSSVEGCLSLRETCGATHAGEDGKSFRAFKVERYPQIKLIGKELIIEEGSIIIKEIEEIVSSNSYGITYQHEIDHASGKLISDIGYEVQWYGGENA
jgi:peptide deformylase